MMKKIILMIASILVLSGCVSDPFKDVIPTTEFDGEYFITFERTWNKLYWAGQNNPYYNESGELLSRLHVKFYNGNAHVLERYDNTKADLKESNFRGLFTNQHSLVFSSTVNYMIGLYQPHRVSGELVSIDGLLTGEMIKRNIGKYDDAYGALITIVKVN